MLLRRALSRGSDFLEVQVKTKVLTVVVVFAGLAAMTVPLFAHHGAASFELGAPVVLKNAVITEFAWINPHPLIKADFKDEKGNVQHWTMELGSSSPTAPSCVTRSEAPTTEGEPTRACASKPTTR